MKDKIGEYAFIAGVLIAVIAALGGLSHGTAVLALVILGVIVGLLNIVVSETTPFLVASIALLAAGGAELSAIPRVGLILEAVLTNIGAFVAPAAVIVALKAIYALASSKYTK